MSASTPAWISFLHRYCPLSPGLPGCLLGLAVAGLGRSLALLAHGVPRVSSRCEVVFDLG